MARRSKQKGSAFERLICKQLSLMITHGKRGDVFWRSAMSGGRATVHGTNVRQSGDICAVAPEGHILTDDYFIECKHYRDLKIGRFVIEGKGPLGLFWTIASREARRHKKTPVLICKQHGLPIFVVTNNYRRIRSFKVWLMEIQEDLKARTRMRSELKSYQPRAISK